MSDYKNSSANSAIIGIFTLLLMGFVLGILYLGQTIIIPITIAALLTFLLAPLTSLLEKKIGRILSVISIVLVFFMMTSLVGLILSHEMMDLSNKLPNYKGNIEIKLQSFPLIEKVIKTIGQQVAAPMSQSIFSNVSQAVQSIIGSFLNILFKVGLIMILVIFMLFNREDLISRMIGLIGQGRIGETTRAMNDAEKRVYHYLYMQLIINFSFASVLTLGLYLIGIPNALLWGGLLAVLRFIPYVGTWISAVIPVLLSFVISSSWLTPFFTILLYLILDLISSNFIEPWLYGASVGVSSTALIIAVVFWTALWGPIGLVLAIPLTVCLVVIGHHVPQLAFLSILLSDEKPLPTHKEFYHHLFSDRSNEAMSILENYLKENPIISLYDLVFIPLIMDIEKDLRKESIEKERVNFIYQDLHDIIEDLKEVQPKIMLETPKANKVICIPARSMADELVGEMLVSILQHNAKNIPVTIVGDKLIQLIEMENPNVIVISVIYPSTIIQARYLARMIKQKKSDIKVIVGLWGMAIMDEDIKSKLKLSGADEVVISLSEIKNLFSILWNNDESHLLPSTKND